MNLSADRMTVLPLKRAQTSKTDICTIILSTIPRGKRPRHIFALVYGTDGVGKSTLCSHAPNPIFVGAEKGTEQLDVARFPQTESIGDLLDQLQVVQTQRPWWKFWNN